MFLTRGRAPETIAVHPTGLFRRWMAMEKLPVLVPELSATVMVCVPVTSRRQVTSVEVSGPHTVLVLGRVTVTLAKRDPEVSTVRIRIRFPVAPLNVKHWVAPEDGIELVVGAAPNAMAEQAVARSGA
jgi:hypothetical protein